MCSQPEFGQEATEDPMGGGLMDPAGQTYDDTQQVRSSRSQKHTTLPDTHIRHGHKSKSSFRYTFNSFLGNI